MWCILKYLDFPNILIQLLEASSHLKTPKNHFRYSRGYYFAHRKLFF